MKRLLMVAYHYPPVEGSSGVHRTLQFSKYLRNHGWEPTVLTVHPRAYRRVSPAEISRLPEGVRVERAFSLDASRHLSLLGYHPLCFALPDAWSTWLFGAVPKGLNFIRSQRPDLIWSTFPIPTAHTIGLSLQRATGLPWIADFRDPMTEDGYPQRRMTWKVHRWIERLSVRHCARAVFTTHGTRQMYADRYPSIPNDQWVVIPNGYDEEDFARAERSIGGPRVRGEPFVLLHSGTLYPLERDPRSFIAALARLQHSGQITPKTLKVVLRASGHENFYRRLIDQHGLQEIVFLEPPLPHQEALAEMLRAGALLVFQASSCNHQVPAKVYEYMRSRRPILGLTDPVGDTAAVLRESGVDSIVRLDSIDNIASFLPRFVASCRAGTAPVPRPEFVQAHSREESTRQLVAVLDAVTRS